MTMPSAWPTKLVDVDGRSPAEAAESLWAFIGSRQLGEAPPPLLPATPQVIPTLGQPKTANGT